MLMARLRNAVLVGVLAALLVGTNASAAAPLHSVVGSGTVAEEGLTFAEMISAHTDSSGQAFGSMVLTIDARAFGFPRLIVVVQRVTCLHVEGNSAWIGGVATSTTDPIFPVGTQFIVLVRDLGGPGQDIMHGEAFPASVTCRDKPALPETVIASGNFLVR